MSLTPEMMPQAELVKSLEHAWETVKSLESKLQELRSSFDAQTSLMSDMSDDLRAAHEQLAEKQREIDEALQVTESCSTLQALVHEFHVMNAEIVEKDEALAEMRELWLDAADAFFHWFGGAILDNYKNLYEECDQQKEEIRRLRECCSQRGARMQIMKWWMESNGDIINDVWPVFVEHNPGAEDWFDSDGVPK